MNCTRKGGHIAIKLHNIRNGFENIAWRRHHRGVLRATGRMMEASHSLGLVANTGELGGWALVPVGNASEVGDGTLILAPVIDCCRLVQHL